MDHVHDMIIIGGGPAGCTAALYAARAGLDTVIAEKLCAGGQMTLTGDIDNYPGFDEGIDGFTLGARMQKGAERFGAVTRYTEVAGVRLSGEVKSVETADGIMYSKTVVISTGADPRKLGIPGEERFSGRGVHYCAHCDGRFYKDKTVAVIGGGNSAAADALYLSRLASKVYLIHRRDSLRAEKIYRDPLTASANTEPVWNSTAERILGDGGVAGIEVKNVKSGGHTVIPCDGVFVSIGRNPVTDFLGDEAELDRDGYVIADETTRTNIPGVYAAGDVRTKHFRQVVTAVSDGALAAHFAEEYLAAKP